MKAWDYLIVKYCPPGKRPCNCGKAWATYREAGVSGAARISPETGLWEDIGAWVCEYGCEANRIDARDAIAEVVLQVLEKKKTS